MQGYYELRKLCRLRGTLGGPFLFVRLPPSPARWAVGGCAEAGCGGGGDSENGRVKVLGL